MKKLVLSALSIILLAGCGGTNNNSKTCSLSVDGYDFEVVLKKENNELSNIEMDITVPESLLGVDIDAISGSKGLIKKAMSDGMASSFGIGPDDYSVVFNNDTLEISIENIEFKNLSDEVKRQMGFDESADFDAQVKALEDNGATCK